MERDKEIQLLGKQIQKRINRLKELNCSIDSSYNTIGIFDNTINPRLISRDNAQDNLDYTELIVFSFN